MDMDELVQCLIDNGFNNTDSLNAIVSAKFDLCKAIEILIKVMCM